MEKVVFCILLLISIKAYTQEKSIPEGWDKILLEGETAYMNLITGEVSTKFPLKPAQKPIKKEVEDPTILHRVEKGETLSTIARKYNMHLAKLYRLNSLVNFDSIEIGDEVVIGYKESKTASLEPIASNKKKYKEFTDQESYHIVTSGETLYGISKKYNISSKKLKQINGLKSNTIFVGQQIKIK